MIKIDKSSNRKKILTKIFYKHKHKQKKHKHKI
jgi:hypothetical protein